MKKLFFSVAALAALLLTVSCQQENLEPAAGDGTVTYSVQMPGSLATKAVGDDLAAEYELIYEVYRAAEIDVLDAEPLYEGTAAFSGKVATVQLQFVKRQDYKVLFWAQASGSVYGEPANLQAISMNYGTGSTPGNGNDEKRDAFYGTQTFVTDGTVITCDPLKRPFAQLNFLATDFKTGVEYEGIPMGNIELIKTTVEVVTAAPSFNVAKGGPVDGATPVNAVFEATNFVDVDGNGEVDLYGDPADGNCVISMNYVLPSAATTNVNATFYYQLNNGGSIIPCSPQVYALTNLDLVENFRTNVSGSLFLQGSSYEVSVSSVFDTPDYDEPIL